MRVLDYIGFLSYILIEWFDNTTSSILTDTRGNWFLVTGTQIHRQDESFDYDQLFHSTIQIL